VLVGNPRAEINLDIETGI